MRAESASLLSESASAGDRDLERDLSSALGDRTCPGAREEDESGLALPAVSAQRRREGEGGRRVVEYERSALGDRTCP